MNHRQTIQQIARRLPHVERHTIAEVLEVAAEVWARELCQPGGEITLITLGKLSVDLQTLPASGAVVEKVEEGEQIRRMYFRFRAAGWLKAQIMEECE